jgi:hypothetical protein
MLCIHVKRASICKLLISLYLFFKRKIDVMSHAHLELTAASANLVVNAKMEDLVIQYPENAIAQKGGR